MLNTSANYLRKTVATDHQEKRDCSCLSSVQGNEAAQSKQVLLCIFYIVMYEEHIHKTENGIENI